MDVSVVVPTYNEADNIEPLINEISEELHDKAFEVIVVDDNSNDGTKEKLDKLKEEKSFLKVIERDCKKGIGSAYLTGFEETKGSKIVQMDADFSHRPEYINDLLECLENNDVAVGSRYIEGGERKDPLHRRIFPLIGSYLYRYLLGAHIKDFTSGFKAYNSTVMKIFSDDLPNGFHFQAASLMKILEKDYNVKEVSISFEPRKSGEPKYDHLDLGKNAFFFFRKLLEKYEKMIKFGIVGASGIAVDMGILFLLVNFTGINNVVSAGLATETAIIWNFLWNEVWAFKNDGENSLKSLLERALKFNAVSAVGLGIKVAVFWGLTALIGVNYLLANLIGIFVVFIWNYVANVNWTWNSTQK